MPHPLARFQNDGLPLAARSKKRTSARKQTAHPKQKTTEPEETLAHAKPSEKEAALDYPVVGIGASAGGLEALQELLHALPAETGRGFGVVQHMAPTPESMLAEILQSSARLPVTQVSDRVPLERDKVYVIPPGTDMEMVDGHLSLSPRRSSRGQHRPVDLFFKSLAEEQGHKSIGVVLSGTATDGTLGLQEIKGEGGITFAQDDTAQHTSMPHSAIAAGVVDFVLPPDGIARELARIAKHPLVRPDAEVEARRDESLETIIELVRNATNVDFSGYKRSTLYRRITRRVVLHKLETTSGYAKLLASQPAEVAAVYDDLLINVTSFFRNPEAFEAFKATVFPRIVEKRGRQDPIRVWSLGCSTGEEAYSIAIAYREFAEAANVQVPLQIFATDLNANGIEKARAGVYGKAIQQDVSAERLRRFFVEIDGTYRISKDIREMCIFAQHNVFASPPFSHLDLLSCRNLLIYLDTNAQHRLLPMLHYAVKPRGFLILGTSETIGTFRDLFELEDAKFKIYSRKPGPGHLAPALAIAGYVGMPARPVPPVHAPVSLHKPPVLGLDAHREADRVLLSRYAPPAVLVNENLEILQFKGEIGVYLSPQPGKATLNLLKMLRDGLVVAVRNAFTRARKERGPVRAEGLSFRSNGSARKVNVEIVPISRPGQDGYFLVLFEEGASAADLRSRLARAEAQAADALRMPKPKGSAREIAMLQQELQATREYLQSGIEQQEAANEEVQSANEELQSINEELETSKEEIQSSNEELATVNDELQNRNRELGQANNDFVNLLGSIQLAMVMLGPDLRIRRFTPHAEKALNLISTDVGRPLTDLKLPIEIPDLPKVLADVIDTVSTWSEEIRDARGRWHTVRIRPYRTLENRIEGAVLVVVDVHDLKTSQEQHKRLSEMLAQAREPIMAWEWDGTLSYWNRGCELVYGYSVADALGRNVHQLLQTTPAAGAYQETLLRDGQWRGELVHTTATDARLETDATMTLVREPDGRNVVIEACRPVSQHKRMEAELRAQAEELRESDKNRTDFLVTLAHELRNPLSALRYAAQMVNVPGPDPAKLAHTSEIMTHQIRNMARMIDDLLDVVKIARGEVQLRRKPLDLRSVIANAVEGSRSKLDARGQQLSIALGEHAVRMDGDAGRLEQVFGNLLGNAIQFTNPGGRIWITLEVDAQARAVVRMRDDGLRSEEHTSEL